MSISPDSSQSLGGTERSAHIEIDLGAIAHNVATLSAQVAPSRVMAVVKADAYGHGAVPVAEVALASGADASICGTCTHRPRRERLDC